MNIQSAMPNTPELASAKVYTDFSGLQQLHTRAAKNDPSALKEVAQQFEAIYLQMAMQSMREANQALKSDLFNSNEMDMYQGMFDKQLSLSMSQKSSMGIADMLVKQLSPKTASNQTKSSQSQQPISTTQFLAIHGKLKNDVIKEI